MVYRFPKTLRCHRLAGVITAGCLAVLLSCQRDAPQHTPVYDVPKAIQPIVRQFVLEAQQRGQRVDTTDLIIRFGTISNQSVDVCGECRRGPNQTPTITITDNPFCWSSPYREVREALIFHELGHCLLNRDHRTDKLPDGNWASLMNGQDVELYPACLYPIGTDPCDRRFRRPYYVDELFDPKTPAPTWGK